MLQVVPVQSSGQNPVLYNTLVFTHQTLCGHCCGQGPECCTDAVVVCAVAGIILTPSLLKNGCLQRQNIRQNYQTVTTCL